MKCTRRCNSYLKIQRGISLPGIFLLLFAMTGNKTLAAEQTPLTDLLDLSFEELLNMPITTTSFYDETPLDVASTVSVINRQDWEQRGARRLPEAFSNLPGVISLPNFLGSYSTLIRGYAQSEARGIATLWDGVSITSYNLSTADVDRPNIQLGTLNSIEVIRGPGSALYGTDAFHGVVALNAFESNVDITRFNARIASNGYYNGDYNHSIGLTDGWRMNMALAVGGQPNQDMDYTYTDNTTGQPATGERDFNYQSSTAVLKLASDPNKKRSYKIGFYYDNTDNDGFQGSGKQFGDISRDVADIDTSLGMTKAEVNFRLDNKNSISFEAYYWDQQHIFEQHFSATQDILIEGKETRNAIRAIYKSEELIANTQFSMAIETRRDKIEMARFRRFDATTTYADFNLPISGVNRTIDSFLMDGKTLFSENKWVLRYGFRFDSYSDFGQQLTPRLGAIYNIDKQTAIKALYGSAFRAPNAIEVGGAPFITGDPNLNPETIDTYELVYVNKTDSSKFEAALFYSDWEDAISSRDTTGNGFDDTFVNLGKNTSQGVEISYRHKMAPWLVDSSASYVESENKSDNIKFTAFPKYIANLGIGYKFLSGWNVYQNNRFHFAADAGPERANIQPETIQNYWRADVNMSKSYSKHWDFFANVLNIFDRDNFLPSLVNADGGIEEPGRSVDIGFRYTLR